MLGVGDEDLRAVQQIAAVDLLGGRLHVAEVGAAAWLRETRGADHVAAGDPGQVALLLRVGAVAEERAGDQRVRHGDDRRHHPVDASELLADHAVGHEVRAGTTILFGDHRPEQTERGELLDQLMFDFFATDAEYCQVMEQFPTRNRCQLFRCNQSRFDLDKTEHGEKRMAARVVRVDYQDFVTFCAAARLKHS